MPACHLDFPPTGEEARAPSTHPRSPLEAEHLGLAHELGNRAMAVSAQLRTVYDSGELGQGQVEALRSAERALTALVATGERLVALAGLAPAAEAEVLDLARLAREVVGEVELVHGSAKRRVVVRGDRPAHVLGVRSHLRLVVDNLVENALKYSPEDSLVAVEVRPYPGGVVLRVLDRGPGIAPHDLPRVREPFFRSRSAEDAGLRGAGLGLSITQALVDRHRGHLEIASRPGRGTRVTVLLPRHPGPSEHDEQA